MTLSVSNFFLYKCLFPRTLCFQVVHLKIQARVITHDAICAVWQSDCEFILEMNSIKATPWAAFD